MENEVVSAGIGRAAAADTADLPACHTQPQELGRARWQRARRRGEAAVAPAPAKTPAQIIQLPITAQVASLLISWRPANLHVAKAPHPLLVPHQRSPSSTRTTSTYRATSFPRRIVSCGSMPSSTTMSAVGLSPCVMPPRDT